MSATPAEAGSPLTLFLCGDVMTGRGVDQILPSHSAPELHEPWIRDAREYVELAQGAHGPVPTGVGYAYPWGDALDELGRRAPVARIVNLETSVTRSDDFWTGKDVHYRTHPDNAACLTAATVDVCVLANNHVLDWGRHGLDETLDVLHRLGVSTAGAGADIDLARRPAVVDRGGHGRVAVIAFGTESSGIPREWAATEDRSGVWLLPDLSDRTAAEICERAQPSKGGVLVASIHWGSNWGYAVPDEHIRFAHALVDGGVDVVHGHSSHHPRPIEIYRGRLILYGCGDLIDDYEGIGGHDEFRDDLVLMFFPTLQAQGGLIELGIVPMRIERLSLRRPAASEVRWLHDTLSAISRPFGTHVQEQDGRLLAL